MPPIHPPLLPLLPLSMLSSHLLALPFGYPYVGSLYIAKNARLRFSNKADTRQFVQPGSRDDPAVIRARLTAGTFATLFNCSVVYSLVACSTLPSVRLFFSGGSTPLNYLFAVRTFFRKHTRDPWRTLAGQHPTMPANTSAILGPSLRQPGMLPWQSNYSLDHDFFEMFWTWVGLHNYVWGRVLSFQCPTYIS
jgi:prenyl protein peptidase